MPSQLKRQRPLFMFPPPLVEVTRLSYVRTGSLHGCSVREQQSNSFIESFPSRTVLLPYPEVAVCVCVCVESTIYGVCVYMYFHFMTAYICTSPCFIKIDCLNHITANLYNTTSGDGRTSVFLLLVVAVDSTGSGVFTVTTAYPVPYHEYDSISFSFNWIQPHPLFYIVPSILPRSLGTKVNETRRCTWW